MNEAGNQEAQSFQTNVWGVDSTVQRGTSKVDRSTRHNITPRFGLSSLILGGVLLS